MPIVNRIAEFQAEMTAWRHKIHATPETAFEERATSDFVAAKLAEFGIEVHRGLAGTGVVGTLQGARGPGPAIGLRADMDALHIHEANEFAHRSQNEGRMHACGHDGHTTMLLGAAKYLAETRNFAGTVRFIFQPAEENEGGGRVMIEEGLFDKFPVDSVYGLHNIPGIPAGEMSLRTGPVMAAFDIFEIVLTGKGAHAATPHLGADPVVAAAALVTQLQTIASRVIDPMQSCVVTVTQIHGGSTWNVIPEEVVLRGTARWFRDDVGNKIEASIKRMTDAIAAAHGMTATTRYERRYPPTVNEETETGVCAQVARELLGGEKVAERAPMMGAEDFAFMLQKKPGCYAWLGNGPMDGGRQLHNPHYDFNDDILTVGASYWARLTETRLKPGT
jgi:hippurate hydrolase